MNDTRTVPSNDQKLKVTSQVALLIGDDPEVKAALSLVLAPEGWHLEESKNLDDALALAKARQFDLIVTSRDTSGQQDVEFLRRIRRVKPHTRIIILTDDSTPADAIASMREHAFGYLSNGFSIENLAETVRTVMDTPSWDDGIEVVSATPNLITLAVRCSMITAERLLQFMREVADLPDDELRDVGTAFREMLLNAMEHGGHFDPEKYVEICYVRTRHMIMARIKDPGDGFTLEEVRHAAIGNPPDDPIAHVIRRNDEGMRPGGYGVMLAKNLVDELVYGEKGNEVLLIKYLPELPASKR
jgi:anti-sigma regulatory factor (Ser/Thr protein kinase)/ActR/RegA family two-component response regulator